MASAAGEPQIDERPDLRVVVLRRGRAQPLALHRIQEPDRTGLLAPAPAVSLPCRGWETDLTDCQQVVNLVERAVKTHGRIDVILNNAGAMPHSPLERVKVEVGARPSTSTSWARSTALLRCCRT